MKLIIHAGMPKAGSTALQERLQRRRKELRNCGVLYPTRALNHNFLIAGGMQPNELPRVFRQFYRNNEKGLATDFADFWIQIKTQGAKLNPDMMVLSGESLWSLRGRHAVRLKALLHELTDDIEIVCYARRPSDFYLSLVQQSIKASHVIPTVRPVRYRTSLEAFERITPNVRVVPYEREMFPDGDVCRDFAKRFLNNEELLTEASEAARTSNESMSAEAMAIIQRYRHHAHPDSRDVFTADTNFLMRRLAVTGLGHRPVLRPRIRQQIDQSSTDLLWLRDKFGVTFGGIDYDNISEKPEWSPANIGDLCMIDKAARERMINMALKDILHIHAKDEVRFRNIYSKKEN